MQYLLNETERRRILQIEYNYKNNIKPQTILKNIDEIKSSTMVADKDIEDIIDYDDEVSYKDIDSIEAERITKEIEKKMLNYAKELQFEKAALLRDQLNKIKENQS